MPEGDAVWRTARRLHRGLAAASGAAGLKARDGLSAALKRLFWIGGVGWAAAACAGIVFGTTLGSQMAAEQQTDLVLEQALVAGMDDTMVLG